MTTRTLLCSRSWRVGVVTVWCVVLPAMADAAPQNATVCANPVITLNEAAELLRVNTAELRELADRGELPGRQIGVEWRFDCAALLAWLRREPAAAQRGDDVSLRPAPLSPDRLNEIAGRGLRVQQATSPDSTATSSSDTPQQTTVGEAPAERSAEDVFLRGNRLLLGRGDVVVDFGQFFARRDSLQLATFATGVSLAAVEESALTSVAVGRVGIFRETELFAGTAYNVQRTQQMSSDAIMARRNRARLGATTVGVRRTLLREGPKRPDVVVSLSGQIPPKDTLPAVGGGLVLVKSIDPVVLFANANYVHPYARRGVAQRPIDTIDLTLGYGVGLNDATAISMGVGGLFANRSAKNSGQAPTPSIFSVRFGVTTALGQGLYLEPSVSLGLSGPAQSFSFGLTMPYAF